MHVVIQGAGRGIGYAMAKQAIAAGATKLVLTARQPADTKAFADLAPAENLHWVGMDFLDPAAINAATCWSVSTVPLARLLPIKFCRCASTRPVQSVVANSASSMRNPLTLVIVGD